MSGTVEVSYFAAARELCGTDHETLALPAAIATVRDVLALIASRHAALAPVVSRMCLAVNGAVARDADPVRPGDELAVLPPVAGGSARLCAVRTTALSLDEVMNAVRHPGAGGIAVFVGVVRDHADDKPVARLDYEAHPELAERTMRAILDAIEAAAPDVRLAALHRAGALAIGDLAVVVAASSPHRAEAFAACREAIERIKAEVPIWKKEWAPDGGARWVNLE